MRKSLRVEAVEKEELGGGGLPKSAQVDPNEHEFEDDDHGGKHNEKGVNKYLRGFLVFRGSNLKEDVNSYRSQV